MRNIRGNGIWTHSLYTSPRNARGVFAENRFDTIGRDALQVGHATEVRVEGNTGTRIGYPRRTWTWRTRHPGGASTRPAMWTARSTRATSFQHINGKCIDLDGFHDGEVSAQCLRRRSAGYGIVMNNTNPDMQSRNVRIEDNLLDGVKYGGIFVIGDGQPDPPQSAAESEYRALRLLLHGRRAGPVPQRNLSGKGAERPAPARGNRIEENEITGFKWIAAASEARPAFTPIGTSYGATGVGETFFSTQRRRERGGTAEKKKLISVFSALSSASPRLRVEYAPSNSYFCALNVSIAFSICRSCPPRKSAGVLST